MTTSSVLGKEKIVSLSQLQKNPAKALDGRIVRIVKNGREIGIYLTKEEFEDLLEENMPLKNDFKKELDARLKKIKKVKKISLKSIL